METLKKENEAIALVTDTGCGMDEEVLKRIFDPFFTLKEVGQGKGLGLSTCLGIVEQHEGSITVSSTPGGGSTFKISLPLSLSKQNDGVARSRVLKRGNGQKILIVEDEEPTLVALSNLVKTLNYKVIPCKDPIQALETSDSLQPDLVLLDRNMPELDGVTCMKKILMKHRKTKFVIISGYDDSAPQAIDEETRALIKGYLVKPSSIDELSEILNQALAS